MEADWVNDALPRLRFVDVQRLSGGQIINKTRELSCQTPKAITNTVMHDSAQKKNTEETISSARKRYLARKATKTKQKEQSTTYT